MISHNSVYQGYISTATKSARTPKSKSFSKQPEGCDGQMIPATETSRISLPLCKIIANYGPSWLQMSQALEMACPKTCVLGSSFWVSSRKRSPGGRYRTLFRSIPLSKSTSLSCVVSLTRGTVHESPRPQIGSKRARIDQWRRNRKRRSPIKDHRSDIKCQYLRLKDAIHPDEANTPVRRACYLAQLLLSGEVESASLWDRLLGQVRTLADILSDTHSSTLLRQAQGAIADRNAYGCLKLLRQLLPLEAPPLGAAPGMTFQPFVPGSGLSGWTLLKSTLPVQKTIFNRSTPTASDSVYSLRIQLDQ